MPSKVDVLLQRFEAVMSEPWKGRLSIGERTYFLIYDPAEQRRIDFRLTDFENVAVQAGKEWRAFSLRKVFSEWMAALEYREAYFQSPDALIDVLDSSFRQHVINSIQNAISQCNQHENSLLAILDAGALFGFCRLSEVLGGIQTDFPGRLLVFFPGEFENNHYRLLDARDGWTYLARPITI